MDGCMFKTFEDIELHLYRSYGFDHGLFLQYCMCASETLFRAEFSGLPK